MVNRQLILLSNAASNQSHLLKEIAMASNVPLLVKLHVQIRDVYESISSTFAADLSFLLQDVSVTCNDADGCFKIDGAEAALTRVDERCRLLFQCAYVKELVSAFQLCTIYGRGAGRPQQMHNSMLLSYGLNPDQMSRLYARMVTFLTYTDRTTMFGLVTMRDKTQTSKIPLQEPVSYPVQVLVHLIALHHWSLRRRFELSSFPVLDAALNMGPIISAGLAIPLCTAVDPNDSMRLICFDGPQLEEAMMHMVEYGPCFEKWVIWDGTCKVPCWRLNRLRSDYNQRVIEFAMPAWLRSIGALRTASAAFQAYALAEDPELFSLLAPLNRHCPDMRKSKHYAAVQPMIEALHALRSYGAYVGITARSYPPAPGMTAVAAALKKLQVAMPELSANQLHSLDVAAFILFPEIASCDAKLCDAAHAVWSRIDGLLKDSIASVSPFTPLDGPLRLPSYMTLCGIPCVVTHDVPVSSDCRCCCTKLHVTEVLHVKDVLRMGRLEILEDETKQRCFELLGHSHLLRLSNPDASDRRFHQGEDILTEMGHVSFLHCPNHSKCGDGKKSIDQCTCRNATHILLDEFIVVQKVRKTFAIEMQSKYL